MILASLLLGVIVAAPVPTAAPTHSPCSRYIRLLNGAPGAAAANTSAPCVPNELTLITQKVAFNELRLLTPPVRSYTETPLFTLSPARFGAVARIAPMLASAPVCTRNVVVEKAASPDFPDSARGSVKAPVRVDVDVHVDAKGAITDAVVTHSSGNADIDASALRAVHKSTYLPKIVDCKAVPGLYIFRADFAP